MALKKNPKISEVKDYYEKFVNYRENREGNARVKALLRFIDRELAGKNYNSAIDIGCGAGITTEHLLTHANGVVGVDLSDERISVAKANGKARYLQIDYSGASIEQVLHEPFDVACVFDCLEHILPERRDRFLENVYNSFTEKVLVSIPEPENLKYLRENRPHLLQIVDEPIYDKDLSRFTILEKINMGIYIYYVLGK